jgi:hypothetical protein
MSNDSLESMLPTISVSEERSKGAKYRRTIRELVTIRTYSADQMKDLLAERSKCVFAVRLEQSCSEPPNNYSGNSYDK